MTITPGQKRIRLPSYDYRNGWFFLTNKTNNSKPYLIHTIHDLVKSELQTIHERNDGVLLDYATIVPNHVHCILVLRDAKLTLSEVWRRFKARTTYYAKKTGFMEKTLWQRNYYEHVIRNEKAFDRIKEYIKNNPLKEGLDFNEIYASK